MAYFLSRKLERHWLWISVRIQRACYEPLRRPMAFLFFKSGFGISEEISLKKSTNRRAERPYTQRSHCSEYKIMRYKKKIFKTYAGWALVPALDMRKTNLTHWLMLKQSWES